MDFTLNHHLLFQGCRFVQKKHPWKKTRKKAVTFQDLNIGETCFVLPPHPATHPPNGVSVVKLRTLDQALALRRLRKRHSAECGARGASKQGLSRSALEGEVRIRENCCAFFWWLLVLRSVCWFWKVGFQESVREIFLLLRSPDFIFGLEGLPKFENRSNQVGRFDRIFWSLPNLEFKTTELRIMVQWPLTFWLSGEDGLYRWDFRVEQIGGPGRTQDVGNPWIQFPALVARHVNRISRCKQGINSERP